MRLTSLWFVYSGTVDCRNHRPKPTLFVSNPLARISPPIFMYSAINPDARDDFLRVGSSIRYMYGKIDK